MKEIRDILKAYDIAKAESLEVALATVVKVEGSSYRHEGARMLVDEEGQLTGAISGGCLEGDARKKALIAISQRTKRVEIYDTREDANTDLGIQLGCNGIVHIIFEYIDPKDFNNPLELLRRSLQVRVGSVLATVFNPPKGTTSLMVGSESYFGDESLFPLLDSVQDTKVIDDSIVVVRQKPTIRLFIAGAGNDVLPLVNMAKVMGWEIFIGDGRPMLLTEKRFPGVDALYLGQAEQICSHILWDEHTYVLLMSHNYFFDLQILRQALKNPCAYIGVLGPKSKLYRMEKDLGGLDERVHGPTGLDLGAETAEEIALSIISQILAFANGRKGGYLSENLC
ncbi:XdhC family protein [Leadbetterella byssophila]|uniref:XdhC family protein n=1 Tax=Leadbetterella byssophila TaxID=316068 RepID=UPI0039A129E6